MHQLDENRIPRIHAHLYPCPCKICKAQRKENEKVIRRAKWEADKKLNRPSHEVINCGGMVNCEKTRLEKKLKFDAVEVNEGPGDNFIAYVESALTMMAIGIAYVAIIWVYIAQYAYGFFLSVYHSDRKTQALVVFIISYIVISATVTYYKESYRKSREMACRACNRTAVNETASVGRDKQKSHKNCPKNCTKLEKSKTQNSQVVQTKEINLTTKPGNEIKLNSSEQSKSIERKPSFLERVFGCCPKSHATNSTNSTISDEQAREIFRQSKLFAIPTEMRQPPAILVYLQELLSND